MITSQALQRDFPDVQAGVTGGRALGSDEMLSSQRDTALATVISLLGVGLFYIAIFWEVWSPLRVQIALQIAICWSLGFATLTVGHLNILSVTFAPVLIGLADNLGIHLAARYSEERAAGQAFYAAMETAARQTGPGIVTAALAVILAFYAVMLADFPGLAELGFIAGNGELLCLLASFTVLPALLAVSERHLHTRAAAWQARPHTTRERFGWPGRYPRLMLGVIGALTLLGVVLSPPPKFDYNLLHLQARRHRIGGVGTSSPGELRPLVVVRAQHGRFARRTAPQKSPVRGLACGGSGRKSRLHAAAGSGGTTGARRCAGASGGIDLWDLGGRRTH